MRCPLQGHRRVRSALFFTLLASLACVLLGFEDARAQTNRRLEGFRFVGVIPPSYEDGQLDKFGVGQQLAESLSEDQTLTLVKSYEMADRTTANQTLHCSAGHSEGFMKYKVNLICTDVIGNKVFETEGSAGAPTRMQAQGALRKAAANAVLKFRQQRRGFDPSATVDLMTLLPPVPRVDMSTIDTARLLEAPADGLEGIWQDTTTSYQVAIVKDGLSLKMVIKETTHPFWEPGMVKASLTMTNSLLRIPIRYRIGNHQEVSTEGKLGADGVLSFEVAFAGGRETISFVRVANATGGSSSVSSTPQLSSTGTGFICGRDIVATNFHVVEGGSRWEVEFPGAGVFRLELLVADRANDLALLKVQRDSGGPFLPLRIVPSGIARLGEELYTLGFPLGAMLGSGHKMSEGILSANSGFEDDPRTFQLSLPVQPGNSGGPVLNKAGEVVGILVSSLSAEYLYRTAKALPQNVNFAVRSDYLLMLLSRVPDAAAVPGSDISKLERGEQVSAVAKSVGKVLTYK